MIEPLVRRETGPIAIVLVPTKEVKEENSLFSIKCKLRVIFV